ncbi:aminopeptidase P N-terminal domain-containing protein [Algoriphagus sp. D3-2-R+10]|uniref:aminopeptidase P family protein n=1 Tax=Algoriphagus aurantiacus TaxID=3103948 RepID=UPI002B391ACE|nr:aminopeptidase P N-terminal domain-containing protein [Algoriphagus sp. D3-2-R+10]MEB2776932.1 aminopeptidase P N-terminal domain-containing protein [Algoriphagus sp. D3-2-R+10]
MKKTIWTLFLLVFSVTAFSQSYFEDGLTSEWHQGRRNELRKLMPANSVAVFFNNPVKNRTNDVDYIYHPNTDFFYLTGFREPNAVLVIFSEKREVNGGLADEMIFVQNRDPRAEMWNGKRLGVEGMMNELGFEEALLNSEFAAKSGINLQDFDKILTFSLSEGIEESSTNQPLIQMVDEFKKATAYPEKLNEVSAQVYKLIKDSDLETSDRVVQMLKRYERQYPGMLEDPLISSFMNAESPEKRMVVKEEIPEQKLDITSLGNMMGALREVKTSEEIALLRKAVKISAIGQVEVMKAAKIGMTEREIQGVHEFIYKRYGAEELGYPSIVGGGNNGCILHYIENDKRDLNDRLLLMDLGAEWRGYTADVTRTIPISGKFNEEEKAIYELVYQAQEAGIALSKPGSTFQEIDAAGREIINDGLAKLGIIKKGESHMYFPHGTSHHIGLDVHDRGTRDALKEGVVFTIEPGIYIPEGSDCDPKWWGIAVRIEDDILITSDGNVNLSGDAPRTIAAIEEMMRLPSVLEEWVLPEID